MGLVPVQFSSHAVNKSLHVAVARGGAVILRSQRRVCGTIVSLQLQGTNIININEVRGRTVNHGFSVVKKTEKASVLLVLHARLLFDSGRKLRL